MYPISELVNDQSISNIAKWYEMYHELGQLDQS
jgi:hypothetical protein